MSLVVRCSQKRLPKTVCLCLRETRLMDVLFASGNVGSQTSCDEPESETTRIGAVQTCCPQTCPNSETENNRSVPFVWEQCCEGDFQHPNEVVWLFSQFCSHLMQASCIFAFIVRSPFRVKHHVVMQYMAAGLKCPLPPSPSPQPPSPYQTPLPPARSPCQGLHAPNVRSYESSGWLVFAGTSASKPDKIDAFHLAKPKDVFGGFDDDQNTYKPLPTQLVSIFKAMHTNCCSVTSRHDHCGGVVFCLDVFVLLIH